MPKTSYVRLMTFRHIVLYSTLESREAGKVSALAVLETVLSVALFWWVAITFDFYLHLWISIAAAPLLLFRSPASIALGAHHFMRYWEVDNSHRTRVPVVLVVLLAVCLSVLVTWLLTDGWLLKIAGAWSFWAAVLLAAVAANIGMSIAVAVWGFWALSNGKVVAVAMAAVATAAAAAVIGVALGDLKMHGMWGAGGTAATIFVALTIAGFSIEKELVGQILRGIGAAAFFIIFGISIVGQSSGDEAVKIMLATVWLAIWVFGAIAAVGGLVGTRGLALVATGAGLGIFMRACFIRFLSTINQPAAGLHAFPGNWLSLIIQTDMMQRPEVIPGLPDGHMLRSENRYEFWDDVSHLEDWKNMLVVGFLLGLPFLLYRISLKSTAWLYLPLIYFAFSPTKRQDG